MFSPQNRGVLTQRITALPFSKTHEKAPTKVGAYRIFKEKRFSQTGFRPLYFSTDVPLLRIRHSVAVCFLPQYAF